MLCKVVCARHSSEEQECSCRPLLPALALVDISVRAVETSLPHGDLAPFFCIMPVYEEGDARLMHLCKAVEH